MKNRLVNNIAIASRTVEARISFIASLFATFMVYAVYFIAHKFFISSLKRFLHALSILGFIYIYFIIILSVFLYYYMFVWDRNQYLKLIEYDHGYEQISGILQISLITLIISFIISQLPFKFNYIYDFIAVFFSVYATINIVMSIYIIAIVDYWRQ